MDFFIRRLVLGVLFATIAVLGSLAVVTALQSV
jgi:hypothetical protein